MTPYHEADDREKVAALMERMAVDGWVGAPLVTWGEEQLLTGAHRYAAYERLRREDRIGWDIGDHLIDIADICAAAGVDWDAIVRDEDLDASQGGEGIDSPRLGAILDHYLSADVRERYGIDVA